MDYTKVSIMSNPEAEEYLIAVMLEAGAQGTQVEGGEIPDVSSFDYVDEDDIPQGPYCVSAYFPELSDITSIVEQLKISLDHLRHDNPDIDFGSLEIVFDDVREADWANAWKKYFKPKKVGEYVVVVPSWEDYSPGEDEKVVMLDPGMAFGTGTHETTRMCIQLLEEFLKEGDSVLDVGCGSGILSITSAKLGAGKVLGVDLDPVAVRVSGENAELNDVSDIVSVAMSDITQNVPDTEKYHVIVANIIADIVIRLNDSVKKYLNWPGVYICSGIIDSRLDDVVDSLKKNGFTVVKIVRMGDWCAIAAINKR